MPALPDVRPLLINILSRYIIQCKLDGREGLPGQRSEEKWYPLLEALCLTVQPQTNLSHCTLQFMRYISLLEQVCKLREGSVDQAVLTDVLKLSTNLALSSELRNEPVTEKLVPVLQSTKCGLRGESVEEYQKKVFDFVSVAMEQYTVLPIITLSSDAFKPVVPDITSLKRKGRGRKQIVGRKRPRKSSADPVAAVAMEVEVGSETNVGPVVEQRVTTASGRTQQDTQQGIKGAQQDTQQDSQGMQQDIQQDSLGTQQDIQQDSQGMQQDSQGTQQDSLGTQQDSQGMQQDSQGTQQDSLGTQQDTQSTQQDSQQTTEEQPAGVAVQKVKTEPLDTSSNTFPLEVNVEVIRADKSMGNPLSSPTQTQSTSVPDTHLPTAAAEQSTSHNPADTKNVRTRLNFDPPLSDYLPVTPSTNLAGRMTTPPSLSTTGVVDNNGMDSLVHVVNIQVGDEKWPPYALRHKGVFEKATLASAGAEMGWSSDESQNIDNASVPDKGTPVKATAAGQSETDTPSKTGASQFKLLTRKGAWSEEESRCLLEGVQKFGEGKWKEIREEAYSVLRYRTTNQLKDKYRNIKGRVK